MIALIIICAVILIFAFLFKCSIRAELKYINGNLDFKVKYLFFTVFPLNKKEKKTKKKRTKKDKGENSFTDEAGADASVHNADKSAKTAETVSSEDDKLLMEGENTGGSKQNKINDLKIKIQQAKILWNCVKKPLIKLFGGIHIDDLMIDFKIGGEDACEAAVNYGKVSAVVYNAISIIRIWFPITVKTVDINCDFDSQKSVYDAELSVKLGLGTAVAVLLTALWGYIKNKNELDNAGNGEVNSDKDEKVLNAI